MLGHPVSIAGVAAVLAGVVIVASVIAAGSAPATLMEPSPPTAAATQAWSTDATITLTCAAATLLTITANGVGFVELVISGPSSGRGTGLGTAAVIVSGPSGSYTARATSTGRLDRMSWYSTAGQCSG